MAEYIDRVEAIEWFMPYAHSGESIESDVIISDLKGMKAADVAQVRHGRWIEHSHLEVGGECSVCGWQFQWFENGEAHYCPHCGAKMDLEASDGKA